MIVYFVTFSGTTGLSGGNIDNADMNAEFEILSTPSSNTFTIDDNYFNNSHYYIRNSVSYLQKKSG